MAGRTVFRLRALPLFAGASLLGGCSVVTRPEPPAPPPTAPAPAPTPPPARAPAPAPPRAEVAPGWSEEGLASWYGPRFHGRRTASGEVFDMEALTAAHPTLPFGTLLRVENLETGDRVRVRINDRGPFVEGRILDLSRRAARELRLLEPGVGRVRVEVLNTPDPVRCWQVQVGAFAERSSAEEARRRIEANGPRARVLEAVGGEHRLWVGPFPDRPEAERVARDENGILVGC